MLGLIGRHWLDHPGIVMDSCTYTMGYGGVMMMATFDQNCTVDSVSPGACPTDPQSFDSIARSQGQTPLKRFFHQKNKISLQVLERELEFKKSKVNLVTILLKKRKKGKWVAKFLASESICTWGKVETSKPFVGREFVKNHHTAVVFPRCLIKADLRKGFDSLNWDSLLKILQSIWVPARFVNWVKLCITTPIAFLSILMEPWRALFLWWKEGEAIGDPLPPYPFVIAMEVLSRMLIAAAQAGIIKGYP